MSAKVDAAIDALVDALAELPEHELEFWQRGNRVSVRVLYELALSRSGAGDIPGSAQVGLSCATLCSSLFPLSFRSSLALAMYNLAARRMRYLWTWPTCSTDAPLPVGTFRFGTRTTCLTTAYTSRCGVPPAPESILSTEQAEPHAAPALTLGRKKSKRGS